MDQVAIDRLLEVRRETERITAPLYRPLRRILPDFGGIDFSPIVVLLIIIVLDRLLLGAQLDLIRSGAISA